MAFAIDRHEMLKKLADVDASLLACRKNLHFGMENEAIDRLEEGVRTLAEVVGALVLASGEPER